jgi:hypothetical protein
MGLEKQLKILLKRTSGDACHDNPRTRNAIDARIGPAPGVVSRTFK